MDGENRVKGVEWGTLCARPLKTLCMGAEGEVYGVECDPAACMRVEDRVKGMEGGTAARQRIASCAELWLGVLASVSAT